MLALTNISVQTPWPILRSSPQICNPTSIEMSTSVCVSFVSLLPPSVAFSHASFQNSTWALVRTRFRLSSSALHTKGQGVVLETSAVIYKLMLECQPLVTEQCKAYEQARYFAFYSSLDFHSDMLQFLRGFRCTYALGGFPLVSLVTAYAGKCFDPSPG